jgi:hypothetical protein
MQPELLLDSTTSALDPEMAGEVLDIIVELNPLGMTMILAEKVANAKNLAGGRLLRFARNSGVLTRPGFAGKPGRLLDAWGRRPRWPCFQIQGALAAFSPNPVHCLRFAGASRPPGGSFDSGASPLRSGQAPDLAGAWAEPVEVARIGEARPYGQALP